MFFLLFKGCSITLNETFGEIDFNTSDYQYVPCQWYIHTAGISQAVGLVSAQELNLHHCRYSEISLFYHLYLDSFNQEYNEVDLFLTGFWIGK